MKANQPVASRCRRILLAAALTLTQLAPSGSHVYALHIWLHGWADAALLVDGTQRAVRFDLKAERAKNAARRAASSPVAVAA